MLKKIKDLSKKECESICQKNELCRKCPLSLEIDGTLCLMDIVLNKSELDRKLEEEIEVEDEKK